MVRMRRKLNDIDECYIQANKEMSSIDLSKKLNVAESSIKKYLSTLKESQNLQKPQESQKTTNEKSKPSVGHYVLTEADSEIGDESRRRGSTNNWKDRIHKPRG
jgi:Mn-dependent DtxR family transcriptional regulator